MVVVLAEGADATALGSVQRELATNFTSSEALGKDLRAHKVFEGGGSLLFKNLEVAVVDGVERERLVREVANDRSPILYFEEERTFHATETVSERLDTLQQTIEKANEQISALREALKAEAPPPGKNKRLTWGAKLVGALGDDEAGRGVKVAVLDTGIDGGHHDFDGRQMEGSSFIAGLEWDHDRSGHGTHCCGTIAGGESRENGICYGVTPGVSLLVGRVLDDNGDGTSLSIIDGIDWALEKQARIISMSLSGPVQIGASPSPAFERIGRRALDRNCLIIAAAGNDSRRPHQLPRPVGSPANAETILAVAAIDRERRIASFSNAGINAGSGGRVDLCGPGVDVYSSHSRLARGGKAYATKNGTSMATPHVAGIAAVLAQRNPQLTARKLWETLETDALPLEGLPRDFGKGLARIVA